jgi:hypothetical protein
MRATTRLVATFALATAAVGGCGDGRETPTAEEIIADSAAARLARAAAEGDTGRIRGSSPAARTPMPVGGAA